MQTVDELSMFNVPFKHIDNVISHQVDSIAFHHSDMFVCIYTNFLLYSLFHILPSHVCLLSLNQNFIIQIENIDSFTFQYLYSIHIARRYADTRKSFINVYIVSQELEYLIYDFLTNAGENQ